MIKMKKMNINELRRIFAENFIFLSACWFWMLSILYILGGLVSSNKMNYSFTDLLISYVVSNIILLTTSFLLALIQIRKQDTSGQPIRLPIDTPFEKLPPIFKNWNKQTFMLQLTKESFRQLSEDKAIELPIQFYFPNKHNNYLANKMNLSLNITVCKGK